MSIQTASLPIEDAEVSATAGDFSVKDRVASLTAEAHYRAAMHPKTIRPSELAGLAMFLSTPAATFITGQTIACNGDYTHSF